MAELLAAGEHEAVVETLFRFFGASDAELAGLRSQPSWRARVAAANTIPRELEAVTGMTLDPAQAARMTAPTLLLTGADSPDPDPADADAVAAALPNARLVVMAGQSPLADVLAPDVFAGHVLDFLRG